MKPLWYKMGYKNTVDHFFLGGGVPFAPPLNPPLKTIFAKWSGTWLSRGSYAPASIHQSTIQPMKTFYEKQKQNSSFEHSYCLFVPRCSMQPLRRVHCCFERYRRTILIVYRPKFPNNKQSFPRFPFRGKTFCLDI